MGIGLLYPNAFLLKIEVPQQQHPIYNYSMVYLLFLR